MTRLKNTAQQNNIPVGGRSNNTPLVSVIVATYRRDYHLERALLSLFAQTYRPVEIIVVDDNADDEWNIKVGAIIKVLGEKENALIVYIKNETTNGSAKTRNLGIKAATGEYITFLDDDDIYIPMKIEKQIAYMLDEQLDFSITDLDLFDDSDRLVDKRVRSYIQSTNVDQLLKYHLMHHMTGTDTLMFKTSYLHKIGGFPLIDVGDEFYLMQRAIESGGKFSYLPGCEVKAYVHSGIDGLSSGESKIKGENVLYEHKKQYFERLASHEVRYIKMRHFAVLAYAKRRQWNIGEFIKYSVISFSYSPMQCVRLFISRK